MLLKAKPRLWAWGLVPLILIVILVVYGIKDSIERDLTKRSLLALQSAGIDGVSLKFDGLDGTLVGKTLSDVERKKALNIVRSVFGVRVVKDQLTLSDIVSPFIWSGALKKNELFLRGHVPSVRLRESLRGLAAAKFPQVKITDQMTVALGAEDGATWFGRVSYALDHLTRLQSGNVELVDQTFNIKGMAVDMEAYKYLRDTFDQALPANIIKGKVALRTPLVKDYNLRAEWANGKFDVNGVVQNEALRDNLLSKAAALFGAGAVTSNLNLGSGAPNGWDEAVLISLRQLAKLESGFVILKGQEVVIDGVAPSDDVARDVRRAVRSNYPIGYRVKDKIRVAGPVLDIISPYKLTIENAGKGRVLIKGFVTSEQMRSDILKLLKRAFGDAKITDQLLLGGGAPNSMLIAVRDIISMMAPLNKGRFALIDNDLQISGEASEEKFVTDIDVRSGNLPPNFLLENLVVYKKPPEVVKTNVKKEVSSEEELAKVRNWLSPEETKARLDKLHIESGAVSAKECQQLMNSIVRGSAIRFGVDSAAIEKSSYDILAKVKSVATHCTNTVIRVEGHTDSDGSDVYNLQLSKRRAQAVIGHLNKLGVPDKRLDAKGFGEVKPVASNSSDKGKALNRRIEFVVFEN